MGLEIEEKDRKAERERERQYAICQIEERCFQEFNGWRKNETLQRLQVTVFACCVICSPGKPGGKKSQRSFSISIIKQTVKRTAYWQTS